MSRLHTEMLAAQLRRSVTRAQRDLLTAVQEMEPCRVRDVAEALDLSAQNAHMRLNTLKARHFVSLVGRPIEVRLTTWGREVLLLDGRPE